MIRARVRKRDGRRVYDVRLRDPAGKEYSRTFLTKKEAEAFEAAKITARNRGTWIDPRRASLTVSEVARRWLETNPAKRTRSAETDRGALQQALPRIGQSAVGSITRADIQRLVDTWRTSYAPSTVQRMYSTVRALFSYAEAAELIDR